MDDSRNDVSISWLILIYLLVIMLAVTEWFEKVFSSRQKSEQSEHEPQYVNENPKGSNRRW